MAEDVLFSRGESQTTSTARPSLQLPSERDLDESVLSDAKDRQQVLTEAIHDYLMSLANGHEENNDSAVFDWGKAALIATAVGVTGYAVHRFLLNLYATAFEKVQRIEVLGEDPDWKFAIADRVERGLRTYYPPLKGQTGLRIQDRANAVITRDWMATRSGQPIQRFQARQRVVLDNGDDSSTSIEESRNKSHSRSLRPGPTEVSSDISSDRATSTPKSGRSSEKDGVEKVDGATALEPTASPIEPPNKSEKKKRNVTIQVERETPVPPGPIWVTGLKYPIWADGSGHRVSSQDLESGMNNVGRSERARQPLHPKNLPSVSDGSLYTTARCDSGVETLPEPSVITSTFSNEAENSDLFAFVGTKKKRKDEKRKKNNVD